MREGGSGGERGVDREVGIDRVTDLARMRPLQMRFLNGGLPKSAVESTSRV